jgi:thiosulfate dehydrogenase [quinone] large subunit
MTENVSSVRVGGWSLTFRYVDILLPFTFLLRIAMAWIFLWSGLDKLMGDWTSAGFLVNAAEGPLEGWFVDLGTNTAAVDVIDGLVIWGQILIGISLMLGVATRVSLFWAGAMIFMFYIAQFPPEHNPFLDEHIVYIGVFLLLGALGAGRILGLDPLIEKLRFVRRIPGVEYFLG